MPTTVIGYITSPESTAKPVVHEDLVRIANQLVLGQVMRFTNAAARTAAFGTLGISPVNGMMSHLADIDRLDLYTAGAWTPIVGEAWHAVGGAGEPAFDADWVNLGSGFGNVGFRLARLGQMVEFTGMADFTSTIAAPATIFTLPVGYRPSRNINYGLLLNNNPATAVTPTPRGLSITTAGLVRVTQYPAVIDPGPISLEGVVFPLNPGI